MSWSDLSITLKTQVFGDFLQVFVCFFPPFFSFGLSTFTFIILVIKEAESLLSPRRAATILPSINTPVSTATWSKLCRANTSGAGRKVLNNEGSGCGGERGGWNRYILPRSQLCFSWKRWKYLTLSVFTLFEPTFVWNWSFIKPSHLKPDTEISSLTLRVAEFMLLIFFFYRWCFSYNDGIISSQ